MSFPQRVLQIVPTPLFDGHFLAMTRHQMGIARALARDGVRTTIATPSTRSLSRDEEVDGVRVARLGRAWNVPLAGRSFVGRLAPIRRIAREAGADLVHERFGILWGGSGAFLPLPRVFQFDAPLEQYYGTSIGYRMRAPLLRAIFRRVDAFFCLTPELRDHFLARFPLAPDSVGVIPDAVDTERFRPGPPARRAQLGFGPADVVVAFLGQFYAWHGADRIPAIAARVRDPRVRFLLIGEGERFEAVRSDVDRRGLSERVRLVGRVPLDEAPSYLAAADVFLAPYATDRPHGVPFYFSPLKIYEALSCGLPVVAPPFGELARLLTPDLAVAVPSNAEEAYAEALDGLARDSARRRAMAERARHRAVAEHSWEARTPALLEVYRLARERAKWRESRRSA